MNTSQLSLLSLALLVFSGCGSGTAVERNNVSGSATFDGKPIVYGSIQFIPQHGESEAAPTGSAVIENGKYTTSVDGQGIVGGPHEIRITAYPSKPAENEDETVEVAAVEPLFVSYTIEAIIEPPTHDIAVPADAAGFDPSKAAKRKPSNVP